MGGLLYVRRFSTSVAIVAGAFPVRFSDAYGSDTTLYVPICATRRRVILSFSYVKLPL
jgi:hypothetical protein